MKTLNYYKNYYIICFFLLLLSCGNRGNEIQKLPKWNKITIRTDAQLINIFSDNDSVYSDIWQYKDSVASGKRFRIPTNKKEESAYITPNNKDSIYMLVMGLITKPEVTQQYATDYVGNVNICVQFNNTQLCCSYFSVSHWTIATANTKRIYDILKRKIKIIP